MADINLNDLLSTKKEATTITADPMNMDITAPTIMDTQQEIMVVTKETEALSPEQRQQVDALKEKIDLTQTSNTLQYGNAAQKNIATFSDSILSQVRAKDSGEVGELLTNLSNQIKGFNPDESESFLKKIPLIGSLVNKGESIMSSYEKLSTKVERIQGELENAKINMLKDIAMFDSLYKKNLEYFKNLEIYIRAGEEKIQELETVTLPKLRAEASSSSDPMAVQVVNDFANNIEQFSKKIHDLKISKTIAIQTAPQLRLIQNNDKILVERVQSSLYNAIPLWKNQMVIALGLSRQQQTLAMQKAVSDTTNELLKRNAEMLKTTSIETAKENNRSIVDIDTVKKVNEDLIATIEETMQIQQAGRQARQNAEQELLQIEGRLKTTLLNTVNNGH